jgi:predicted TIM-barrel fold metal-dependent hydrolase
MTPLQLFHRQCYLNTWYDAVGPFAGYLGADRILWSSNMPRSTSTWPRTQEVIDGAFEGVADDVRKQVLWGNAASLYKL